MLEDHYIFPKDFLKSKNVEVDYDIILNRTLIFSETNRKISNKSPVTFINEMVQNFVSKGLNKNEVVEKVKNILKRHFINEEMFEILKSTNSNLSADKIKENFERFTKIREALIINKIKELVNFEKYIDFVKVGPKISDIQKLYKQFWESLLIKSNAKFDFFSSRNSTIHKYMLKKFWHGIELYYNIASNGAKVGIYIDFGKNMKELNTKIYDFLYKNRKELEGFLEEKSFWRRTADKTRTANIYFIIDNVNINQIERWDNIQEIVVDKMFELYNLMKKYIPSFERILNKYQEIKYYLLEFE